MNLAVDLESRNGGLTKDSLITNGFVEKTDRVTDGGEPVAAVLMRPGLAINKAAAHNHGQALIAQGSTKLLRISNGIIDVAY